MGIGCDLQHYKTNLGKFYNEMNLEADPLLCIYLLFYQ